MKRAVSHQIDELAKRILGDALPPTWLVNQQEAGKDYAKDYLVEIGEHDGELTGMSFFIQLKGKQKATILRKDRVVTCAIESKYARYYHDRIKDLPVFLVVADTTDRLAWWIFLQPILAANASWKKKSQTTIRLPLTNDLRDIAAFQKAIVDAKRWLRVHHSEAIQDSIEAAKLDVRRKDPRFDVDISVTKGDVHYQLLPKETVSGTLELKARDPGTRRAFIKMIEQGGSVAFKSGELNITGSKLFEDVERLGCELKFEVKFQCSVSLIILDTDGKELGRLNDVPGEFSGGSKQLWFRGGITKTPFGIGLGPFSNEIEGSMQLTMAPVKWNGQTLLQLAYFDRLASFFDAIPQSNALRIEIQRDGNVVHTLNARLPNQELLLNWVAFLDLVARARRVCKRVDIDPVWSLQMFSEETIDTIQELHSIFFESGFETPTPNARLTATVHTDSIPKAWLSGGFGREMMRVESTCTYDILGHPVEVGRLAHEFTEMVLDGLPTPIEAEEINDAVPSAIDQLATIVFAGTPETIKKVKLAATGDVECRSTDNAGAGRTDFNRMT